MLTRAAKVLLVTAVLLAATAVGVRANDSASLDSWQSPNNYHWNTYLAGSNATGDAGAKSTTASNPAKTDKNLTYWYQNSNQAGSFVANSYSCGANRSNGSCW